MTTNQDQAPPGTRGPSGPATPQRFGDDPLEVRETGHYTQEYVQSFVEKWDELIDWRRRYASEGNFFVDQLRARGVTSVLDVATGTGFHSVRLLEEGFETVVSADGKALPAATLPEAGRGGFDHGPLIQSLGKMGNVGRGLDSGTVTMGDFVRAKLEHAGLQQGSDAWVGQAVLMCVHGA